MQEDSSTVFGLTDTAIELIDSKNEDNIYLSKVTIIRDGDWFYVDYLQTPESLRGNGYARRLLTKIIIDIIQNGFMYFEILVSSSNEEISNNQLVEFYESVFNNIPNQLFYIEVISGLHGEIDMKISPK